MWFFWLAFLETIGSAVPFTNESIPHPKALTAGAPQPATGARWENAADEYDFPDTLLDDKAWEHFRCKGDNLIKAMHLNDIDAGKYFNPPRLTAESPWNDFAELAEWYWHQQTDPYWLNVNFLEEEDEETGAGGFGIGPALNALGMPDHTSDNPNTGIQIIYVVHADLSSEADLDDQRYEVAGRTYRATNGQYKIGIETSTGAILGLDRKSPAHAAEDRKPKIEKESLPELQRASDVAWLFWAKHAVQKNKLKYFFNIAITNEETHKAIRRALKNTNQSFGPWPGATFSIDSVEGRVLLGSPNGLGHGYFLAQHKFELGGNMYISKVQVWQGETEPYIPNMVFYVEQPKPATKKLAKQRGLRKMKAKL